MSLRRMNSKEMLALSCDMVWHQFSAPRNVYFRRGTLEVIAPGWNEGLVAIFYISCNTWPHMHDAVEYLQRELLCNLEHARSLSKYPTLTTYAERKDKCTCCDNHFESLEVQYVHVLLLELFAILVLWLGCDIRHMVHGATGTQECPRVQV